MNRESSRPLVPAGFAVHPLSPERWSGFETLFGAHGDGPARHVRPRRLRGVRPSVPQQMDHALPPAPGHD
jgi:hypothetical protein